MNKTISLAAIGMVAVVMGMSAFAPAIADSHKVDICHVDPDGDGNGPEIISVSSNGKAIEKHLAHGDHLISEDPNCPAITG